MRQERKVTTRHVRIHGRVQGVWFRAWAKQTAQALDLVGWVRNCDDGTVEAKLQGDIESVRRFIESAHEGSRLAQVSRVEVQECQPIECSSFEQRE